MSGAKPNEAALDHTLYLIVLPREGAGDFSSFHGFGSRLVNSKVLRQGEVTLLWLGLCRRLRPTFPMSVPESPAVAPGLWAIRNEVGSAVAWRKLKS